MPVVNQRTTIAAGATNENTIAGSAFEYLPRPCLVEIGVVQIDGAASALCFADISSGADILAENMPLTLRAGGILMQDDVTLEDQANAGDRLKIRVRNADVAARIVQTFVRISYIG
jgi:hypothetical protein